MTQRIWDAYLTDRDKELLKMSGYGARQGFGRRPALMVIDVSYAFCGDRPEPIFESVKRFRNSCGEEAWQAIGVIRRLQDAARAKGLPIVHTNWSVRPDGWDIGSWAWKNSRTEERPVVRSSNLDANEFVREIAPQPTDIVVMKIKASGFHGTPMNSLLRLLNVDSLVVAGTTTSGCVRATVLDAFAENYRVSVVEDACFDRTQASHAINLFDMEQKYADVVSSGEAITHIESLPAGMFELPTGIAVR